MPRIRYIKPDFFKDEDLSMLPFEVRLFYAGMWGLADKAGRLEERPLRLKAEIFPYENVNTEKALNILASPKKGSGRPFIQRYEVNGQKYIQILNWEKHQKPHHTEKDSEIPPAPPLMEKGMEKGMEKEKQDEASPALSNGEKTVKTPLRLNTDEEFLARLKNIYSWVDIDMELKKMDGWLSTKPGRKKTRRFIVNWLNKIDKPMGVSDGADAKKRYL